MVLRFLTAASGLFLVLVVMSCEPNITATIDLTYDYPYCPTTDSLYQAADSVPLGCPTPTVPDTLP